MVMTNKVLTSKKLSAKSIAAAYTKEELVQKVLIASAIYEEIINCLRPFISGDEVSKEAIESSEKLVKAWDEARDMAANGKIR